MSRYPMVLAALVLVAGCLPASPEGTAEEGLTFRASIDLVPGAMITGHSRGARRIAYVTPCDGGGTTPNELRLLDDWNGTVQTLATGVDCFPNLVQFSPDGELAAFGMSGEIHVVRASTGKQVVVARGGIGVDFSPDSSWLVVATTSDVAAGASLEAWDADLVHHQKIADGAYYSPFAFGGPFANLAISPDSKQLLFLGQLAPGFPIGTLTLWTRASGKTKTIAAGVPVTAYAIDAGWARVAYLRDAVAPMGPPFALPGTLAVRALAGGAEKVIGATQSGIPLAFARDGAVVLYTDGQAGGASTLKAWVIATAKSYLIDSGVFSNLGRPTATVSPRGDAVAYLTAWNPMIGGGDLRLATVPDGPATPAPRTVGANTVVNAYAFADGGGALVYLHDPDYTLPGAGIGKLSAFDVDLGTTSAIATGVTQQGIKIDPAREDVLYVDAYDGELAAGDLQSWNARTGKIHLVGHRAAVMSVATSPAGVNVGFLQLAKKSKPDAPPSVSLQLARSTGLGSATRIDADVTSFVVGPAGRVVYSKSTGLWGAFVL